MWSCCSLQGFGVELKDEVTPGLLALGLSQKLHPQDPSAPLGQSGSDPTPRLLEDVGTHGVCCHGSDTSGTVLSLAQVSGRSSSPSSSSQLSSASLLPCCFHSRAWAVGCSLSCSLSTIPWALAQFCPNFLKKFAHGMRPMECGGLREFGTLWGWAALLLLPVTC